MIVLEGQPTLSRFRRERLESQLRALSPDVRVAGAWHVYWVEPADAGQAIDSAVLHRILQAGDAVAPRASDAVSRHVAPRLGTISRPEERRVGKECVMTWEVQTTPKQYKPQ